MIITTLALAATAIYGGAQYIIARNGVRWSEEQHAAEAKR